MLRFDRKQQNFVKQLSFNKKTNQLRDKKDRNRPSNPKIQNSRNKEFNLGGKKKERKERKFPAVIA